MGRKIISPPPSSTLLRVPPPLPYNYSLISDRQYLSTTAVRSPIANECKTFCGLVQDGLLTSWKFVFVFDPPLYELQLLVLELFHFAF